MSSLIELDKNHESYLLTIFSQEVSASLHFVHNAFFDNMSSLILTRINFPLIAIL